MRNKKIEKVLDNFINWREKHVTDKQFTLDFEFVVVSCSRSRKHFAYPYQTDTAFAHNGF